MKQHGATQALARLPGTSKSQIQASILKTKLPKLGKLKMYCERTTFNTKQLSLGASKHVNRASVVYQICTLLARMGKS